MKSIICFVSVEHRGNLSINSARQVYLDGVHIGEIMQTSKGKYYLLLFENHVIVWTRVKHQLSAELIIEMFSPYRYYPVLCPEFDRYEDLVNFLQYIALTLALVIEELRELGYY